MARPMWDLSVHTLLNDWHFSDSGLGVCLVYQVCLFYQIYLFLRFTRTRLCYSLNSLTMQGNYSQIRVCLCSFSGGDGNWNSGNLTILPVVHIIWRV